jgi:serine/threonine protein kinase
MAFPPAQGGFGKVYQARHKESGDILAMKSMRKDTTLQCDHFLVAIQSIFCPLRHFQGTTLQARAQSAA